MATLAAPPSPEKQTTATTGGHRDQGQLLVSLTLLTFNSGLVIYILRDDSVSVASAGVTYVAVGLLLGRLYGCWVSRWLDAIIGILLLSLGVLQVSRLLARTLAPPASSMSVPMLLAAASSAALVVGGGCAYLLHRLSWSKKQRQEAIFLQLRQDPRN